VRAVAQAAIRRSDRELVLVGPCLAGRFRKPLQLVVTCNNRQSGLRQEDKSNICYRSPKEPPLAGRAHARLVGSSCGTATPRSVVGAKEHYSGAAEGNGLDRTPGSSLGTVVET